MHEALNQSSAVIHQHFKCVVLLIWLIQLCLGKPSINSLGWVAHIIGYLTIIDSDNGLSPGRRQAIISTNAGALLIGPLATSFSEILIEIITFAFKKMRLNVSSAKRQPQCVEYMYDNQSSRNGRKRVDNRQAYICLSILVMCILSTIICFPSVETAQLPM